MDTSTKKKEVNLLWTGGLDSTYRILELVLEKQVQVQPYYVKDPTRPSTNMELKTMEKLRNLISKKNKAAAELIKPTLFFNLNEIPENQRITSTFKNLQNIRHIGHQYDWLARFCDWQHLNELELGVIKKGEVSNYGESLSQSFAPYLSEVAQNVMAFDEDNVTNAKNADKAQLYFELFKFYHFPIIHLSKKEMINKAQEKGWFEILEKIWFCHRPKKGKPCGKCNPCRTAVSEGLGDSIPYANRFIYNLKTKLGIYWLKQKLRKNK